MLFYYIDIINLFLYSMQDSSI